MNMLSLFVNDLEMMSVLYSCLHVREESVSWRADAISGHLMFVVNLRNRSGLRYFLTIARAS